MRRNPEEKSNKLKETSHSLSNLCGKPLKNPSFCLQFSFCKPKPQFGFENSEAEVRKSSDDRAPSLIARHYSTFMQEFREKTSEIPEKHGKTAKTGDFFEEIAEFPLKKAEDRENFGLFLLKNNQRLILARIRENSLRFREKNQGKTLGFAGKTGCEQQILSFVAKTLKKHCESVLDVNSGDILALLALSKENLTVFSVSPELFSLQKLRKQLAFQAKVEFIHARLEEIRRFPCDVAFINLRKLAKAELFQEISKEKLLLWSRSAENLAILLPKTLEISELANQAIRVEKLSFSDEAQGFLVLLGDIAGVSLENQVFFLTNYVFSGFPAGNSDFFEEVAGIIRKIGVSKALELLNLCDEAIPLRKTELLLQRFLELAQNFKLLSETAHFSLKTALNQRVATGIPKENRADRLISSEKPGNFKETGDEASISLSFSEKPSFFEALAGNSLENTGNSQFIGKLGSEFDASLRSGWSERE